MILPEGIRPAPWTGGLRAAKPKAEEPVVVKQGREERGTAGRAAVKAAAEGGAAAGERTAGAGAAAGAAGPVPGAAPGPGSGSGTPGFRLVYPRGGFLQLAKIKADPIEQLMRPERYEARPDVNLAKYVRPNPLRPDALPPGGGGGGAAGAAIASKAGPVAAVAATPPGGIDVPDNVRRFDFRPWANEALARVQKNWSLLPYGGGSWKGEVGILVMIAKSGEILGAEIKVTSNVDLLDQVALSALRTSEPLPPLPEDFPNSSLELYLVFKYGY